MSTPEVNGGDANIFLAISNILVKRGDDMEDVARELAIAFKAIVHEGLGKGDEATIIAELKYLIFGSKDDSHRDHIELGEEYTGEYKP